MRRRAIAVFCVATLGPAVLAQSPPQGASSTRAIGAIDAFMKDEMRALRIPGAAVAVVESGRIVLERAYGVSNLETMTALDASSVFELASITKQFTAAALLILVEEGKVRLDDPVSAYIERSPPAWADITVRHLLTHTSGLDISAVPRSQGSAPLSITTTQVFESVSQQKMPFRTGQEGWYSDAGYFLLGMVIEKASGQRYRDFLARRVFGPLGMDATSVTDRARVLKGRVSTYSLRNGEHANWRRDWDYELPSFFGIWSTLQDLAAWDASLRQGTLLKASSLAQMWTPATLENGQKAKVLEQLYGFGFELSETRGHATVGHGGASGTYILRFLDEPLTIIVLTNLDVEGGRRHPKRLARAIAGLFKPQYLPPHLMTPRPDPDPDTTRVVQSVLADIGARRASEAMSTGYRAWYQSAPGAGAWLARQVGGAGPIQFLGRDAMAGRSLWGGEPLEGLVHYSTDVKGQTMYVSVGITRERQVATLDYYSR